MTEIWNDDTPSDQSRPAFHALGGVVKSAVIPAIVGIRINLGPNTTLLVRILDSRLRGNDVPSRE